MDKFLLRMFYLLLAAIAFFELVLGNLLTLAFNIGPAARTAGLTVQMEVLRLVILIVLDAAAGLGALAAHEAIRRENAGLLKKASLLSFIGFGLYAAYQLASAALLLAPGFRLSAAMAGLAYGVLGVLAFHFGRLEFHAPAR